MRRLVVPLVALLMLVPALPALASADAAETGVTHWRWAAPDDFAGALVVGMTFDFGETQHCDFFSETSGTQLEEPVHFWEESNGRSSAFYSGWTAQVHATVAGQDVDVRDHLGGGGEWSLDSTRSGPHEGVLEYVLAVTHAEGWTGAATGWQAPLVIDVTCEEPFTVSTFKAGREAFGFTDDNMDGGVSVTASQIFGAVAVMQDDRAEHTFSEADAEVTFTTRFRGYDSPSMGELTVTSPAGTETADLAADAEIRIEDGPPGTYAAEVDLVFAGLAYSILGYGYSVKPVANLDDAL